jgi:hypothetical protein
LRRYSRAERGESDFSGAESANHFSGILRPKVTSLHSKKFLHFPSISFKKNSDRYCSKERTIVAPANSRPEWRNHERQEGREAAFETFTTNSHLGPRLPTSSRKSRSTEFDLKQSQYHKFESERFVKVSNSSSFALSSQY